MSDAVDPTFDTPDTDEVLQEDERPMDSVPVNIVGIVRTEEMPCLNGDWRNVLLRAGTPAQKIANADPRRKRITLWPVLNLDSETVVCCVSESEGEANQFRGALLISGANAIARYDTAYAGELWCRPCVINDSAGIFTTFGASTQDTFINVVQEQWAN